MITLRKKIRGYFFITELNLLSNLDYKCNTINEKKRNQATKQSTWYCPQGPENMQTKQGKKVFGLDI